MPLETLAKTMILAALALLVAGAALYAFSRLGLPRLPGDLVFEGRNWRIVLPIATSILLSILLTVVLNLIVRFWR